MRRVQSKLAGPFCLLWPFLVAMAKGVYDTGTGLAQYTLFLWKAILLPASFVCLFLASWPPLTAVEGGERCICI
jgi:hypothetical protein